MSTYERSCGQHEHDVAIIPFNHSLAQCPNGLKIFSALFPTLDKSTVPTGISNQDHFS